MEYIDINPNKLIPVEIEWVDTHASLEGKTMTELEKEQPIVTKSCGYLMSNDKEKVVLAFMLFGVNALDETLMRHYQVIPKKAVIKITKLKKVKENV